MFYSLKRRGFYLVIRETKSVELYRVYTSEEKLKLYYLYKELGRIYL